MRTISTHSTRSSEEVFVPGNNSIKNAHMKDGGYYCHEHEAYVNPLIVRVGEANYPACEDCFMNDLVAAGKQLGDPVDTGIEVEEDELVGETELEQEDETTERVTTGD